MVIHIKAILDRLGLDFWGSWGRLCASWTPSWRQLGGQDRSRAAQECPRAAQESPKNRQESPKTAQECPRRPRSSPGAAQDSPRASQKPTKMPRSSPGPAQDLPRTRPDPTHYLRLQKNSQFLHAILQNFLPSHRAAEIKNERRRYSPPRGSSIRRPTGSACEISAPGLLILPDPPSGFFFSEVLVFPLLNPPPVASGRLHPLRRSAALARLGASWVEKIVFQEAFKK